MTHLTELPQRALVHQLVLPGKVPAPLLVGLHRGVGLPLVHSPGGWLGGVGVRICAALLSCPSGLPARRGEGDGGAFKPSHQ